MPHFLETQMLVWMLVTHVAHGRSELCFDTRKSLISFPTKIQLLILYFVLGERTIYRKFATIQYNYSRFNYLGYKLDRLKRDYLQIIRLTDY